MKRKTRAFLIVLVVLLILSSLCGCNDSYYFDYEDLKEKVQKIEIIDYNVNTQEEKLLTTIPESNQDQFLRDLSEIRYNFFLGAPSLVTGPCVKLIYKNNDYEIITWGGTSKDGRIQCPKEVFEEMLKKYYSF